MSKELGNILKKHRTAAGLTQNQIAQKFGYKSPQFVSNWERGMSQPPLEVLFQLCTMLKIPKDVIKELIIKETVQHLEMKIDKSFRRAKA